MVSKIHKKWENAFYRKMIIGHSDTNLEVLPAKIVLLSAVKRLLIRPYDENVNKMFAL